MLISVFIFLNLFFTISKNVEISIPQESTAKAYTEKGKKFIGVGFDKNHEKSSSFKNPYSLNVKLDPVNSDSLRNCLSRPSELVIKLKHLENLQNDQNYLLKSFLVSRKADEKIEVIMDPLDLRVIESFSNGFESILLPSFNDSLLPFVHVTIFLFLVKDGSKEIPLKLELNVNVDLMLVLTDFDKNLFENSQKINIRTDDDFLPSILPCRRVSLIVDFVALGWGNWILAPRSVNIFQCFGSCSKNNFDPSFMTGNAIIRSMLSSKEKISTPCCTPSRLKALSLITKNDEVLEDRKLDSIIVDSCGCQ